MRQSVLNYIVCPRCGGEYDLTASVREADHVMQGCLRCRGCGSEHPIEDGVPIILDRTKEEGHTNDNFLTGYSQSAETSSPTRQFWMRGVARVGTQCWRRGLAPER